eukprot:TRINITY_DN13777_c0_g1_i1.p1 TRINITY_DN13777_c0_g1~~TRINITY_DN13777_c0_g1_i1.p1  ORF type:complete len:1653 (+),score=426.78 TRINITY_DN13777_c0_g1_i1:112-5070(+)
MDPPAANANASPVPRRPGPGAAAAGAALVMTSAASSEGRCLEGSFDSKEDYELYKRLMEERQRIQQQQEASAAKHAKRSRRKPSASKPRRGGQCPADNAARLQALERGFELCVSGANKERVEELRKKSKAIAKKSGPGGFQGAGSAGRPSTGREWQIETVELRGQDGQFFKISPHAGQDADEEEEEEQKVGQDSFQAYSADDFESGSEDGNDDGGDSKEAAEMAGDRPDSAASGHGSDVDRDTRGVLRILNDGDPLQLTLLRETLTKQMLARPLAAAAASSASGAANLNASIGSVSAAPSPMASSNLLLGSRATGGNRPSSSASAASSASAIASAIQAENARVKQAASGTVEVPGSSQNGTGGSSRPGSSRPSSGSRRRLPFSLEAAADSAPPSALGSSGNVPQRPVAQAGGSGYISTPPVQAAASNAPSSWMQGQQSSASSGYTSAARSGQQRVGSSGASSAESAAEIAERVSRLDWRNQKALLRMLDELEAGGVNLGGSLPTRSGMPLMPRGKVATPPTVISSPSTPSPSAPSTASRSRPSSSAARPSAAAWTIRVLSNWGDAKQCGLLQIEALDVSGAALRIPPAALSLCGVQGGSAALPRVVDGRTQQQSQQRGGVLASEKAVWTASVVPRSDGQQGFEAFDIVLNWPAKADGVQLAALRLWGLPSDGSGGSGGGSGRGVRAAEVWKHGRLVWSGDVPQACQPGQPATSSVTAVLDAGFDASRGAAADGMGQSPPRAAAASSAKSSPGKPPLAHRDEKPIWLSSNNRTAAAGGYESSGHRHAAGSPGRNNGRAGREHKEECDYDLRRSLQALEQFRSSQSRKFFGKDGGTSEDMQRMSFHGSIAESIAPEGAFARTANFGMSCSMAESFNFDGEDIPVRSFDEDDLGDDLPPAQRPDSVMGSSLVASFLERPDSAMHNVVIPTMPRGRRLVFNCVSTWGDNNFVGLAGIEIFDGRGYPIVLKDPKRQVTASPASVNVLPEYQNDPRTVDKLFDQVNFTRDDLHVWLAPFFEGKEHTITVDLEYSTEVAMIRVWNYNKSRLHSSRGVRDLEILLDGEPIFAGEVRQAPGLLVDPEQACEHILFTQEESVLEAMEERDWLPEHCGGEEDAETLADTFGGLDFFAEERLRPATGQSGRAHASLQQASGDDDSPQSCLGSDGRPITRANFYRPQGRATSCSSVTLVFHSTWGDAFYVGLTALEVLDASLQPIDLRPEHLEAAPRDLNDLEGVDGDARTVDKLLDGVTCTADTAHMWLAPVYKVAGTGTNGAEQEVAVQRNVLRIDLGGRQRDIAGFHIWNYNQNMEDNCRGVREFSVYCDERYVATFLCRKAPGHTRCDFKQVVLLDQPPSADANVRRTGVPTVAPRIGARDASSLQTGFKAPPSGSSERSRVRSSALERSMSRERQRLTDGPQQQYETPLHPCGFVFKLVFSSTWSDIHYVGLDAVEFYDLQGQPLRPKRVFSSVGSVRDLEGMQSDTRTEDNLLRGGPPRPGQMFLAPFIRQPSPHVELVFDEPTRISCMRIWNYSRTPSRGVRDLELYVDDILVYQGVLRRAIDGSADPGELPPRNPIAAAAGWEAPKPPSDPKAGEAVLFTTLPDIVMRERPYIYLPRAEELITFFDQNGQVDASARTGRGGLPPGMERPMTALDFAM